MRWMNAATGKKIINLCMLVDFAQCMCIPRFGEKEIYDLIDFCGFCVYIVHWKCLLLLQSLVGPLEYLPSL